MGGEPELIQGDHGGGGTCHQSGRKLRFLFQLGDVLGLGGDAPVVYVYGCDEHPDEVVAFLDMY
jgi:hypothetical protein